MADFTVIETQEQFDAAIGERIKREKETLAKKYEGYLSPEDFKTKTSEYDTKIGDLDKALKEANEKIAGHDKEIAERDKKIKDYESSSLKTRVAHEAGLSYDAVKFLRGETEDDIKKSAESLKALVGTGKGAPPLASGENGNGADAALRNTLRELRKGE